MSNKKNSALRNILFVLAALLTGNTILFAQTPDPGLLGTHAVLKGEYNLGDAAYTPPSAAAFPFAMEVRGSVHYPADIATGGPYPVLVWLHGRHSTCYNTTTLAASSAWPCPTGRLPILSYAGYDYAAKVLASHGYIVISISANSINAHDGTLSDAGMNARGVLTQHHLDLWNGWNTTVTGGPFGTTFVGKLNMQKIGTMGHSRGGEGVVFNAEYNKSLGSPYGIKAVLTLAPVDFMRHVLTKTPLMNIAPYCDGDVSDLQGVHFYDDARYKDSTDETPKHNVLMLGANHNFFNTVWTPGSWIAGGADDWEDYGYDPFDPHCGTSMAKRFDTTKQKAAYIAYAAAFYRYYLGNETQFAPILKATDVIPPASSLIDSTQVFVSYHAGRTDRYDINRVDSSYNFTTNNVGGAVTTTTLTSPGICGGGLAMPICNSGVATTQRPHRGTGTIKGLGQMRLRWTDTTGTYKNAIPAASQNFSSILYVSFRACINFSEMSPGPALNFTVQLVDSAGAKSNQVVDNFTNALFYEPGTESGVLPKVVFNTIQLPVSGFTGINLSKVRSINFIFNKSTTGAILISDLALIDQQCGKLNAGYADSVAASIKKVFFKDSSITSYGDTVTRLWKFGHPSSGVNDTSTALNPSHTYSTSGTYTVCLYMMAKRRNGATCLDTFCTSVVVPVKTGITTVNERHITIVPNPAKDYLEINGAEKTDVLRIINLYGQEVFTTTITQPVISLPQTLPTGFYYVMVISPSGTFSQKILISR